MYDSIPSPMDLAKKEDTRTISLRIKEKTITAFEKYAKQNKTTTSSLINGVLDSYIAFWREKDIEQNVKKFYQSEIDAAKEVLAQYLDKQAVRVKQLSDEDLCKIIIANSHSSYNDDAKKLNDCINGILNGNPEHYFSIDLDYDHEITCASKGSICKTVEHEAIEYLRDEYTEIKVPAEKFPIVAHMAQQFRKKKISLINEARMFEVYTEEATNRIVEVINSSNVDTSESRVALAKSLAKLFSELEEE